MIKRYYIYSFIFLIGLTSCSKYDPHCPEGDEYQNLSFSIPYKQGDVVTFKDSTGNKLTFTLDRIAEGYYRKTPLSVSGDCGPRSYQNQYNNLFFQEKNNNVSLFIGNYAFGDTIYDMSENLYIAVNGFNFSYWTEWLKDNLNVIPEITLNGKKYTNVFIPDAAIWPGKQVYYSKQYGLVGFQTDSVLWSLDN